LTAVLETDVANGRLVLEPDGGFTYTPDDGFVGTDRFTYRADDGDLASAPATVAITVEAVGKRLVEGGPGADVLVGSGADERFLPGGGGIDTLTTGAGEDDIDLVDTLANGRLDIAQVQDFDPTDDRVLGPGVDDVVQFFVFGTSLFLRFEGDPTVSGDEDQLLLCGNGNGDLADPGDVDFVPTDDSGIAVI
jgi:hypothetical protein